MNPDQTRLAETLETSPDDRPPVQVGLHPSSPSVGAIFRVVVITLILLYFGGVLSTVLSSLGYLLFLLILSVFLAYLMSPLVQLIRRPFKGGTLDRFMPRSLAILIAYLVVFSVLAIVVASVAPLVIEQGKRFGTNLPTYAAGMRQSFNDLNSRFDRLRLPEDIQVKINEQAVAVGERITTGFGSFLLNLVSYTPWLIIVPVLAFFFLKDVHLIRETLLKIFPAGSLRKRAHAALLDVNSTLAAYTRAQLISCLLIGTVCTIGFYLIGLEYALLLGILAGVFEFVPLLGPALLGVIAVTTTAFSDRPWSALYVFIFLISLRLVHDYVTYPRIVRGGIHLHPALIILSVLAGEQVGGIPGVFLGIPIVAIITVIYKHVVDHTGGRGIVADLIEPRTIIMDEEVR